MFRGTSFHKIDPKGRIIMPARFRDVIKTGSGNGVMVTQMDQSLFAYTYEHWRKVEESILASAETDERMRRFVRIFIGGAQDCICDKQGRFLIPPVLRQYACLENEIVLVGVLNRFEIWSREKWDNENQLWTEDIQQEDIRNRVAQLPI